MMRESFSGEIFIYTYLGSTLDQRQFSTDTKLPRCIETVGNYVNQTFLKNLRERLSKPETGTETRKEQRFRTLKILGTGTDMKYILREPKPEPEPIF